MATPKIATPTTTPTVSPQLVAQDFRAAMAGKMDPDKLEAAAQKLVATSTSYPATGSIVSVIFFLKFQLIIDGGKTFDGKAGGIASPGGGALAGDVYTDDIDALYSQTHSFEFNATPVYTSLLFFDGNQNLLGNFQGGAVSIVTGIGGGTGEWS